MKKLLSVILSTAVCIGIVSVTPVSAAEDITVEIDGKVIEFDVNPEIIDGRTMVPLRKIFEEIGANVKWDNDTKTVSARKNKKTITMTIGSSDLQIDKGKTDDEGNPIIETVTLEVPAQIVSDRTLVPARAISESFGLDVDWDENSRKVIITDEKEKDNSWEENVGTINLDDMTYEGKGIEIDGNQIKITEGGDFTLSGTLSDGNITISTKEKVKLRLKGANITSENNPCIFVEKADKAYITVSGDSENFLIAKNSDDGAIYSKENLEIKGNGNLKIESLAGHGIKASDNLNIENSSITINATSDGIHINDTFKMTGGALDITAIGDGIDCESIVNISAGTINIETNGTPIQPVQTAAETSDQAPRRGMWEEAQDVEFEKSTKGINSEWMMCISGAEININSASHAIHCADEIEINGGSFTLASKYDKGISAHGNLTINGADTIIDITKSTEGLESKKVMTINDGVIKVVATDDALNATGGNSGMMMPGGNFGGNTEGREFTPPKGFNRGNRNPADRQAGQNGEFTRPTMGENGEFTPPFEIPENGEFTPPFEFAEGERPPMDEGMMPGGFMGGGMGRNMKECLVINGGYFEIYAEDDCLDANGNLTINGGTVKAIKPNGSFYGAFGIVDPDGQTTISENANLIFAAGNGSAKSLNLKQNTITINCEKAHKSGDNITVLDANGDVVYEYAPDGSFQAVLIASGKIKIGEKYLISVGDETFETEITEQSTVIGTQQGNGNRFGKW